MSLTDLATLFLGGGAGAACRYAVGHFIGERYSGEFPLGTFSINIAGCVLLGFLASTLRAGGNPGAVLTLLVETGFLGGFTTFSTYTLEGVILYVDGSRSIALVSLILPVVAGMAAAACGAAAAFAV